MAAYCSVSGKTGAYFLQLPLALVACSPNVGWLSCHTGLATESDQEQHLWIGGADGVLRVHDVHSGHLLKAWKAHNAGVAGLSLCRVERATANHSGDYSAFYNADNATMDSVVSK